MLRGNEAKNRGFPSSFVAAQTSQGNLPGYPAPCRMAIPWKAPLHKRSLRASYFQRIHGGKFECSAKYVAYVEFQNHSFGWMICKLEQFSSLSRDPLIAQTNSCSKVGKKLPFLTLNSPKSFCFNE